MSIKNILLLGNERLYETSQLIQENDLGTVQSVVQDLHDTMIGFRNHYGWGRAISAPQIGVNKRLIYIHVDKPIVIINPKFTLKSRTFTKFGMIV